MITLLSFLYHHTFTHLIINAKFTYCPLCNFTWAPVPNTGACDALRGNFLNYQIKSGCYSLDTLDPLWKASLRVRTSSSRYSTSFPFLHKHETRALSLPWKYLEDKVLQMLSHYLLRCTHIFFFFTP